MSETPVLHAFNVPVHTPVPKELRKAGKGITVVSMTTVVARDEHHAREIAEMNIKKFLGDDTIQTWTFPSEIEIIARDVLAR